MVGFTCVVILALAVIFMFMSYQQTISQKNQELFWRDIMSDIMLQNLDNVYIMIEVNQKQTVYVSPNVERVFGISHTSAHPLFAIQELELSPETLDFPIEDLMQMPNGRFPCHGVSDSDARRFRALPVPEICLSHSRRTE